MTTLEQSICIGLVALGLMYAVLHVVVNAFSKKAEKVQDTDPLDNHHE